jgi:hypothetical protein
VVLAPSVFVNKRVLANVIAIGPLGIADRLPLVVIGVDLLPCVSNLSRGKVLFLNNIVHLLRVWNFPLRAVLK